jgi:hypothetical protein
MVVSPRWCQLRKIHWRALPQRARLSLVVYVEWTEQGGTITRAIHQKKTKEKCKQSAKFSFNPTDKDHAYIHITILCVSIIITSYSPYDICIVPSVGHSPHPPQLCLFPSSACSQGRFTKKVKCCQEYTVCRSNRGSFALEHSSYSHDSSSSA